MTGWYDYRTNQYYDGGQTVTTSVDKAHIPVFVRGGSILPLAVDPYVASKTLHTTLEIRVYPGADVTYTLYEDDGYTNEYEQGACSRITFQWDEHQQQLTVGDRQGSFRTMPQHRQFVITMPNGKSTTINYQGKEITITKKYLL